ncbi:prenyltransferase [filamentous cyanobacterium CCT1]|nr:prenyltransferase [filamentous cyanobacterium CCT1]PSN76516.1 prenyltransferase [filamentous cyanobacterium CCP4]
MTFLSLREPLQTATKTLYQLSMRGLVYPSFWVSAAIASLVIFVQITLDLPRQWEPIALIFSVALIPYNLDRIADTYLQKIPDSQAQAYFRQGWGWLVLGGAAIAFAVLLYRANPSVRWVSLGVLVPLVYGLPLVPAWGRKDRQWWRLKDIPASKAWIVSGTITYALMAVPLAYANASFTLSAGVTTFFLLIFVGTNSHLFDVRDLESDRQAGVLTLPRLLGVDRHRQFWFALNGLALVAVAWGWTRSLAVPSPAIALSCLGVNLLTLRLIQPNTPRDVYSILVDGYLFLPSLIVGLNR